MDVLARRVDCKNAIDIFHICIERYPQTVQAYAFFGHGTFRHRENWVGKEGS